MNEKLKENGRIDFFTIIVFSSPEEREEFHREISVPLSEQYISQEQVRRIAKE